MFLARRVLLRSIVGRRAYAACPGQERTARGLVVGMYQKEGSVVRLTKGGIKYDEKQSGRLMQLVEASGMAGRVGDQVTFTNMAPDMDAVAVVGLGRECEGFDENEMIDVDRENVRVAVSTGVRRLERQNCTHITVDGMDFPEQAAEATALTLWKYQDNIMEENRKATAKYEVYDSSDEAAWNLGLVKADAQNLARRLCDTPANQMTPIQFAQAAVEVLCPLGVQVEVRNLNWIETNGFTSFLAVARSSCEPPVMLELTYCKGGNDDPPVLLLGQGLTFNTGGICLKPPLCMLEHRAAMSGAAICVGVLQAIATLTISMKLNVLLPLCENMASGMAVKPGDVINVRNGKSVCIHDTNEIGALSLIDAMIYGTGLFSPGMVIDVGAFTDEMEIALSGSSAGLFTKSNCMWANYQKAGGLTGDRLWRMPAWKYFTQKVTDYEKYDTSNTGHGRARGMACKTAAFIDQFNTCADWAHIDVRGVGMLAKNDIYPYTQRCLMSGRPTRTLIEFFLQNAQK